MSEAEARDRFEDSRIRRLDPQASQRPRETSEAPQHEVPAASEPKETVTTSEASAPDRAGISGMIQPVVVGGLAGAVFAVATVFAMTALSPPLDPRVPGLAQQVAGFKQEVYTLETAVRATEVDVVRALEADGTLAERLDTQNGTIADAMSRMDEARALLQLETGPGSIVFGVSTVQLSRAIESGRPFEGEWVNLYALTEGHPELRSELSRLMPFAADGSPTLGALRDDLRAIAAQEGTPVIDPANYIAYGLDLLQTGLGIPVGTTAEAQVVSSIVTSADRRLSAGDIDGALEVMSNLPDQDMAAFRAWRADAQRAAAARTVSAGLQAVSNTALKASASQ
jgi:hypothetical protein